MGHRIAGQELEHPNAHCYCLSILVAVVSVLKGCTCATSGLRLGMRCADSWHTAAARTAYEPPGCTHAALQAA